MYFWTHARIIFLLLLSLISCSNLQNLNNPFRPMPPEFESMFGNKTANDLKMEECMESYVRCSQDTTFKYMKTSPDLVYVCAYNTTNQKRTFVSYCDMSYVNCKHEKIEWMYLQDGRCPTIETKINVPPHSPPSSPHPPPRSPKPPSPSPQLPSTSPQSPSAPSSATITSA